MRSLLAVIAFVWLTGCIVPRHRGLVLERRKLWAPAGAPVTFSWVSRVEQRETTVVDTTKDDLVSRRQTSDRATRTTIYAVDPATEREVRLGELAGDGGEPLYYDAGRRTLWVRGEDDELVALAAAGAPSGLPHGRRQVVLDGLAPPFVLGTAPSAAADTLALYDLRTGGYVAMPATVRAAEVALDGAIVRFTTRTPDGDAVRIQQIVVDASAPTPRRLPDVAWSTPPLAPSIGERVAATMLADGRRYVELVRGPAGLRLYVFEVATAKPPVDIPLPAPATDGLTAPNLVAVDADALVFGEDTETSRCWRGASVRVSRALVVPLPKTPCIEQGQLAGRQVPITHTGQIVVVDAEARLVVLEGVEVEALRSAVVTGPTTRALARRDPAALIEVDLATGDQQRSPLVGVAADDRLLAVGDGVARFARGADTLVTVPLTANAVPQTRKLAAPVMTRADRMPRDRTELWLAGGGGVTTRGRGVAGIAIEVAHWMTDRWLVVGRAVGRFEQDAAMNPAGNLDAGATIGLAWQRLPKLWSLGFGGDLGASYAASYVGETRTDRAFAPSAEVHIGGKGSMFGLDVAAVVPSLLDLDRGVQLMVNLRLGFTENQR